MLYTSSKVAMSVLISRENLGEIEKFSSVFQTIVGADDGVLS